MLFSFHPLGAIFTGQKGVSTLWYKKTKETPMLSISNKSMKKILYHTFLSIYFDISSEYVCCLSQLNWN